MIDLKAFRRQNNLTQDEVGAFLGVKKAFISSIENKRCGLPEQSLVNLINNDRGWDVEILKQAYEEKYKQPEQPPKEQRLTSDDIRILLDNIQQREKHFEKLLSQYDVFLQQTSLLIRQHDALIEQQNKLIDFIIKK